MQKSDSIKAIAKALITFHVKVEKIPKDANNPFFKSRYASLSAILDAISDPLNESELSFCQFPSGDHGLTTLLMHVSGEWISSEYTMKPTKDDPQGVGSAITYQRRYALAAILGLNIDEDDDGNEASKPAEKKQEAKPEDDKPWLNKGSKEYVAAVNRLQKGTATIQQIKEHFKLSKDVYANLEACTKELIPETPF